MRLRTPPGRSGRIWVGRRLALAGRGAELLDQKRRALLAEEGRLAASAAEGRERWLAAAREAGLWAARAAALGGGHLRLLPALPAVACRLTVRWERTMGVVHPSAVEVEQEGEPALLSLGAPSPLHLAAAAHRRAVAAAAAFAAAERALDMIRAELALTARRQRVIERRWMPALRDALHDIELALDGQEREDGVRVRWLKRRQ
jgi:V/A-type H+-transporting ATPase subunit D